MQFGRVGAARKQPVYVLDADVKKFVIINQREYDRLGKYFSKDD